MGYPQKKKRNDRIAALAAKPSGKKKKNLSYREIGSLFGISKERVYKILKERALRLGRG